MPWHTKPADNTTVVLGGLVGLAIGNPKLGVTLGSALADPGGDPLAPSPYIVLKIAGRSNRIAAVHGSYAPRWRQPIAVDGRALRDTDHVVIQVMDAFDDSLIFQHELTFGELVAQPARTFTQLGPVASLDVHIQPISPARRDHRIIVPSTVRLEALAKNGSRGWTAVPVWNGDLVTFEATGRVCPSNSSEDCFGPNGVPERWQSYNYPGFKSAPHVALVAIAPGAEIVVGPKRTIRIEQSGYLLLFVNDEDVGNNRGEFDVRVTIVPP